MKNTNPHHNRSTKRSDGPRSVVSRSGAKAGEATVHKAKRRSTTGSILIWTLMLGFVLTSVFFFFAMRQRAQIAIERDTAAILNAKAYVESYAGYLENLGDADLETIKNSGDISFDGIKGKVTNEVSEIISYVDFKETKTYDFKTDKDIYIEWNKCPNPPDPKVPKGDLKLKDAIYKEDKISGCSNNKEYDDVIGPITITSPFTIESMNAPFNFRITEKTGASTLVDNKWHMDLEMSLGYGNKVAVKRTF